MFQSIANIFLQSLTYLTKPLSPILKWFPWLEAVLEFYLAVHLPVHSFLSPLDYYSRLLHFLLICALEIEMLFSTRCRWIRKIPSNIKLKYIYGSYFILFIIFPLNGNSDEELYFFHTTLIHSTDLFNDIYMIYLNNNIELDTWKWVVATLATICNDDEKRWQTFSVSLSAFNSTISPNICHHLFYNTIYFATENHENN